MDDDFDRAEMMRRACELRRDGHSYRQIADVLGVALSTAHALVHDALEEIPREVADDVRELELARLDVKWSTLRGIITDPTAKTSDVIRACEVGVMLSGRRAKYLGLDKPAKADVNVNVEAEVTAESARAAMRSIFGKVTPKSVGTESMAGDRRGHDDGSSEP